MTHHHHMRGFHVNTGMFFSFAAALILIATAFICNQRIRYAESCVVSESPGTWNVPGVTVESYPNSFTRIYHTRVPLTYISGPGSIPVHRTDDTIPVRVWAFRNSVFAVTGVTDMVVYPYSFRVTIGRAFAWEEVEPRIAETIMQEQYKWMRGGE